MLKPGKSYCIILARYYQNWEVKKRNSKARFPRKIITLKVVYKFAIMLTEHRKSVHHLEMLWILFLFVNQIEKEEQAHPTEKVREEFQANGPPQDLYSLLLDSRALGQVIQLQT